MVTPVGLVKAEMVWNGLARRDDVGGALAGLGEEAVAPGNSGQLKWRRQVAERRKAEAIM